MGVGVMTDARWKQTYDLMVTSGQLKPIAELAAGVHDAVRQGPQGHAVIAGGGTFPCSSPNNRSCGASGTP
jgi:hypothetical protein